MKRAEEKSGKFKLIIGIVLIFLSIALVLKLLFPLIIILISMSLSLIRIYTLIEDVNFLFIGGAFFLVIYWFVFSAVCRIVIITFEKGINLINQLNLKEVLKNDKTKRFR